MKMRKSLHPKDDIERLYVSRKEVGRGLAGIKDSVNASRQRLKDFVIMNKGRLITVTRNNTDNTRINEAVITKNKNGKKNNQENETLRYNNSTK